jgi:uncharacterized membrane protein YqaE (UPF0057 family)
MPKKKQSQLTPKRHHGYAVLLFILGTLFPPLAVAARFGIGKDFWLNLFLTICAYIPGHVHNFYIQNIRNNKNHARTPKWAQRYGLVDTSEIKRKERKSQWATRYNDRLPQSTLENQEYEQGQEHGSSVDVSTEGHGGRRQKGDRQPNGNLWNPEDESFYGGEGESSSIRTGTSSGAGRWHYPANFDDAAPPKKSVKKKEKKEKKDRWARTEDAYSISEEQSSKRKTKKKSKSSTYSDSTTEFPEDAAGGLYGEPGEPPGQTQVHVSGTEDVFDHQF